MSRIFLIRLAFNWIVLALLGIVDEIGLFDEDYFAYYEDVETKKSNFLYSAKVELFSVDNSLCVGRP